MTQEFNAFDPPRSNVAGPNEGYELVRAGKWRRFGTFVIDYIGYILASGVVGVIIGLLFGERGINAIGAVPNFLLGFVFYLAYYLFFEGIWGRTPGKLILGTIAVGETGRKVTPGEAFKRTLCRFIPFEAFSFFGERGWHDSVSRTHVVLVKP